MNPLHANFAELYQRHMCRHSQFGINVLHLISLIGTYWALYGFIYSLFPSVWLLAGLATIYMGVLAFNLPIRVFLVTLAFIGLFLVGFFALPVLPFWVYPIALLPFYELQQVSHRFYDKAFDMTEFNQKYPKGRALFLLLTVYELPIQLNRLFFGSQPEQAPGLITPELGQPEKSLNLPT
jgi:hypothetical protein